LCCWNASRVHCLQAGDVEYWDSTLASEIEGIRSSLAIFSSKRDDAQKASLLDNGERQIRSTNGTVRSYKMECRLLSDPNERKSYENKLKRHERDLKELSIQLQEYRQELNRGELFVNAQRGGESPEEDGDAMLVEASKLQDKTKESLDRTANLVSEAKSVGLETMEELRRQREQISHIDEEAQKIEGNLKRADKLIKTFGRRMATDRFIQCFACVNVFLLVGVIVYIVVMKQKHPDANPLQPMGPTNPVRMLLRGLVGLPQQQQFQSENEMNVLQ
jgi:SNARE protein